MTELRKCPHCSKVVGDATGTCPHCGVNMDVALSQSADESKCPNCGAELKPDDVICVQCGTNLLTGALVVPRKVRAAGRRRGAWLAIVLAFVVVAGGAGAAIWYFRHDYAAEGRRLFLEGRLTESAESFDKALRRNDRDPRLFLESGVVGLAQSDFVGASERFARVMELDPMNARAQLLLGVSYALQGESFSELSALEKAVSMDPGNSLAHFVLGLAYTIVERREQGAREIERAVELDPRDPEYRRLLGAAYIGLGKYAE
ncbi:MAG: tetratricopeptide repeat protein, partial [Candidatus Hydrogenedentes bacterium]|nr:tetratricopeptide repeat protein [Candidatus Hydrogenedentota bacterium]